MLHTLSDLDHYAIKAIDGTLGIVTGFYCDQKNWRIKFIVVELGNWAASNKVLISTSQVTHINREDKNFAVSLSAMQIKNASPEQVQALLSEQDKFESLQQYAYPSEWSDVEIDDTYSFVNSRLQVDSTEEETAIKAATIQTQALKPLVAPVNTESHLRTCASLMNYHVEAVNGEVGFLEEMLIEEQTWSISYFIVSTGHWWMDHQVLISPKWIKHVSWNTAKIYVRLTQQEILDSPVFDSSIPISHEKELNLLLHYGRDGYHENQILKVI